LRVKTTSTQQAADYFASDIQYTPHAATFSLNGALYSVSESSLALVAAATLAVATVEALGLEPQRAVEAIASYASVDGRGAVQTIPWGLDDGVITVIDQSYNSSPVAVAASLETFGRMPVRGRRIAVLGDMKELGGSAAQLHAGLADAVVAAGVDSVVTVGALMRHLYAALPSTLRVAAVDTAAEALTAVAASIKSGDAVLVKGSHSVGLESVVAGLARGRRNAV
ncbi:MAG: UDP-N-acetylmuramoyl-tripeptide--D-alanyl-D-alanine ligase, partial [Thalassospira sp.]|nr:UDP-N-acetylmuramoyl-tripeptide--D-alanyl-D-alanine ligase [Thalassospira sp.]